MIVIKETKQISKNCVHISIYIQKNHDLWESSLKINGLKFCENS
jgi:hypothetical protein